MRRFRGFEFTVHHLVLWSILIPVVVIVSYVWVPYRLPDGEIEWSWGWAPPMVIDETNREIVQNILASSESPAGKEADEGDREIRELIEKAQYKPAYRAWTQRGLDWPATLVIWIGIGIHVYLSMRDQ